MLLWYINVIGLHFMRCVINSYDRLIVFKIMTQREVFQERQLIDAYVCMHVLCVFYLCVC